jgi:hypothetical protein
MTVSKRPTTPKTAPPDKAHHPNSSIARCQVGTVRLREGNTLNTCVKKLVEHGWLVRGTGEQVIAGSNCTTFWRVVRPGGGHECGWYRSREGVL